MSYQFKTQARLPTKYGEFDIHIFENNDGQEHILLSVGLPLSTQTNQKQADKIPLVRIHSECLTGDAFGSLKCDCGPQLNTTMQMMQDYGCGAILYLRQEGRGIGLTNKIRAYALQDQGHDTLQANLMLGLPADGRTYEMCAVMLNHLGIKALKILTNNPHKLQFLEQAGFNITERIPLVVGVNPFNQAYLDVKKDKMGHLL